MQIKKIEINDRCDACGLSKPTIEIIFTNNKKIFLCDSGFMELKEIIANFENGNKNK